MTALVPYVEPPVEAEVCGPGFFLEANPFRGAMRYVEVAPGATLADYAEAAAQGLPPGYRGHLQIWIGEHRIEPDKWPLIKPKDTASVYVRVRPQGKGGKNILRAVIMIAIIAAAVYFLGPAAFAAGGWIGGAAGIGSAAAIAAASAAAIAAVTLVATLALNALIPPPGLTYNAGKDDPRYQLTGSNNRFAPYQPVPRLFGKMKVYPVLAARPYTENVGKHQYLRLLLCVGWGPIKITDIRIGNSPITAFRNTSYEVFEGGPTGWVGNTPITLYNRKVTEQNLSFELIYNTPAAYQTTAAACVEIACDIIFPYGLIEYDADGDRDPQEVRHKFEYRVALSGGAWLAAPLIDDDDIRVEAGGVMRSKGKTPETVRHTARWTVPAGQYEVRVTRLSVAGGNPLPSGTVEVDRSYWTVLRSYATDAPVLQDGLCLIALRMQATDQLNGVPDTISCVAEAYLPVLGASDLTVPANYSLTQSPARAFADVLRRRGGKRYLEDARIDIATLQAWETACVAAPPSGSDAARWTFNGVIEGGSIYDALRRIASIGRANYTMKDGKHSVVRDVAQSTPIQHITPRNSWGYSGSRTYADLPHAFKVEFQNKDADYRVDERVVYADGYTAGNATRFEVLQLFGCTSSDLAFREARYHHAVGALRPEEHRVNMDIENLRCTLGDRVQLSHDVIDVGLGAGRIAALDTSGVNTVGFTLDTQVEFPNNFTFQLRTREANGDTSIRTVTPSGRMLNGLLHSAALDNAAWTKTGATVTANAAADPNGIMTLDKLVPSAVAERHMATQNHGLTGSSVTFTVSAVVDSLGYDFATLGISNGAGAWSVAQFNLATGALVAGYAYFSPIYTSARIENLGGGRWRLSVSFVNYNIDAAAANAVTLMANPTSADPVLSSAAGNGTDGIAFGWVQVEEAAEPGDYVYTGPYTALDVVTRNHCTYSEQFDLWYAPNNTVTVNADGVADKVIPTAVNTTHYAHGDAQGLGNGPVTISVKAKPAGYKRFCIAFLDEATNSYTIETTFDVAAGTIVAHGGSSQGVAGVDPEPDENGYYRVWVTGTTASFYGGPGGLIFVPQPDTGVGQAGFLGNGVDGVLFKEVMATRGAEPGYYVKTGAASALGGFTDTVSCSAETTTGGPAVGDLFMFGVTGVETLPAIVKRIEPGDDLSAVLTLAPYDAAIHTADTGSIPAFSSYMTADYDRTLPGAPTVALRSDNTAADILTDGTAIYRLGVDITPPGSSRIPVDGYEVRYRLNEDENWNNVGALWPFSTPTVFIAPVLVGAVYEVSVRSKGVNGLYSAWVQPADHTIVGNAIAPNQPSAAVLTPLSNGALLTWTNPVNKDLKTVQVWAHTANVFGSAAKIGEAANGTFTHDTLLPGDTRYYWLVAVNASGATAAALAVGSVTVPAVNEGGGGGGGGGGDNYVFDPGIYYDSWTRSGGFTRVAP